MRNSGKRAAKAGVAYTVGNVLLRGVSFLTLPIFSRILSTEEYGLYNLYVSYETLLTIFVGVCLYGSLRTAKYDYEESFDQYLTSAMSLSFVSFFVVLVLGNSLYPLFFESFEFDRTILNILIVHSYAMFVFQFYNTRLALDFRYKQFLLVSGANSIGGTVLSIFLIVCIFKDDKHIARIYGYAFVPIVIAGIIIIWFVKNSFKKKNKIFVLEHWRYGLIISIPLVVHTFSQQILHQFDRIMISRIINNVAVGIYSFIYTIANILQVIVQSMDNAWSVWMYEQLRYHRYEEIKKKAAAYVLLMNILYVGFISLAPDVIRITGTKEYHTGIPMVVPLAFSIYFVFLYSLPVHVEYYYKKTKFIAMGTLLAATLNIALNFLLIENAGYQAAAWNTLASYIALFIFHWQIAKKIDSTPMFPTTQIVLSIISLTGYSVLIIALADCILLRWTVMCVMIVCMLLLCRNIIKPMINMIPLLKKYNK